jgi:hypothetical protein
MIAFVSSPGHGFRGKEVSLELWGYRPWYVDAGSPKGDESISSQYVSFLERSFPGHHWTVENVSSRSSRTKRAIQRFSANRSIPSRCALAKPARRITKAPRFPGCGRKEDLQGRHLWTPARKVFESKIKHEMF